MPVYNASASAPIGWYRLLPAFPMHDGDLVLVPVPEPFDTLAADRGYLPRSVPLVKRVASAGAAVCASGNAVTIDGKPAVDRLPADREGRALPAWSGCCHLAAEEIFLLMPDVPDPFDGRYFGPVAAEAVIGRLEPLWLRCRPAAACRLCGRSWRWRFCPTGPARGRTACLIGGAARSRRLRSASPSRKAGYGR